MKNNTCYVPFEKYYYQHLKKFKANTKVFHDEKECQQSHINKYGMEHGTWNIEEIKKKK